MYARIELDAGVVRELLWSGGSDTLEDLTDEEIEQVLSYLEDCSMGTIGLTDLNDFFWFERDTIADWLGYSSYDELMNRGEDE